MDKVLILGAKGMLGQELVKVFGSRAVGFSRQDADVTQFKDLGLKIKGLGPSAIINCAAYNYVDGAEDSRELAFKINSEAVGELALICKELNIILVHFSTNYVFDGQQGEYIESDPPNPLSIYGQSKHQGELALQKNTDKFYLIRAAVLFGPKGSGKPSFVELMQDLSEKSNAIRAINNEVNSITYVADLAQAVKTILDETKPFGIYHVTNTGSASWYDIAKEIFAVTGKKINLIPVSSAEFPRKAKRPQKSVLVNTKLPQLRPWQKALKEFLTAAEASKGKTF